MTATTLTARLTAMPREQLLRLALKLDAVVTGVNGIAYLALAGPLEDLFGLPDTFLRPIGAFLTVFALAVWLTASRREVDRTAVAAIVAANAAWAVGSIAFAATGAHDPTTAGTVWIVLQGLVVAAFAAEQAAFSRR